jgi:hypothetical protein
MGWLRFVFSYLVFYVYDGGQEGLRSLNDISVPSGPSTSRRAWRMTSGPPTTQPTTQAIQLSLPQQPDGRA